MSSDGPTTLVLSKKYQIEITVVVVGDRDVPKVSQEFHLALVFHFLLGLCTYAITKTNKQSNFCHLYASGSIPEEVQGFGTKVR